MNKILVQVYVPAIEKTFDLFIPINKKIHRIIQLIEKMIHELGITEFAMHPNTKLIDKETGALYELNANVLNTELKNGSKLIII